MSDRGAIRWGERVYSLAAGESVTFGRSPECDICLDEADPAISRLAGRVSDEDGRWWLVNVSASRALGVVDEFGLRSVLPPGRRTLLDGRCRILVDGVHRTHEIAVAAPSRPVPEAAPSAAGEPTVIGEKVLVNDADRAALVALFAGYLEEGARYDPNPKSYAAAAARLGWPRTTLVKRIEYLRARLSAAGVPNLTGWNALNHLAEYALTTGVITRADLAMLRR
ncbi:MAG TPA: hypothetical protein VFU35_08315 [Jatrophihabitans sp.]|nr:hypothetical protein [Jatrophihabitans sp.]